MAGIKICCMKDIVRPDYIRWWWHDVTPPGEADMVMARGRERTPAEAHQAATEFDTWINAYRAAKWDRGQS